MSMVEGDDTVAVNFYAVKFADVEKYLDLATAPEQVY